MIGRLCGLLIEKKPPMLLIDISGVGYEVQVSMHTFYQLPELGQKVVLLTHFVVREDAQLLYGFHSERERELFRHLIKVNGVGPKLALAILSGVNPDLFIHCIQHNDSATLVKIPGVGKKTAERLIIEMRDRLDDVGSSDFVIDGISAIAADESPQRRHAQDAISALVALGYKPQDAARSINQLQNDNKTSEQLIREALKQMVG